MVSSSNDGAAMRPRHGAGAPRVPLLAAAAVLLAPLLAAPAPAAADDSPPFSGQVTIGYRRVDVGGRQAKYREDYDLQDGLRLFGLDLQFTPPPELRAFADRIDLELTDFGGDPFESLHLGVRKFGAFNFRFDHTKSSTFYDDQLIPSEQLDVALYNGGDFHRFDFERVRDAARLDVDLTSRAKVDFGFERSTKVGTGTTTFDVERDEFQLVRPIDESLDAYHGGFQYSWKRVTLVLLEEVRDDANAVSSFLPGASEGEAPPPGNGALDFYFLDQPYASTSRQHTVRILARPNPRLSVRLTGSFQNLDLDATADERVQGLTDRREPFATTTTGRGTISREVDLYDLDLAYRFTARFTLTGGLYSRRLDQEGDFAFGDAFNQGFWTLETTGGEVGLQVSPSPRLTVSGGLRRESRDVRWYATGTPANVSRTTDDAGLFATVGWRPTKTFRLTSSVETQAYDDPYTLASPTERSRVRVRGQRDFGGGAYVAGSYLRTAAKNENSEWDSTLEQLAVQFGYHRPGLSASIGYASVAVDRSILQATNAGPYTIAYAADSDFIDGRLSWTLTERWTIGGTARYYQNGGSFALTRSDYSGFVEVDFTPGYLLRVGYRSIDYDEDAADFDDYRADVAELAIGYRW
jgi:hypothetical protein